MFFFFHFFQSFISCSIGIWNVGFVMICYGVVDAICSFTFGQLVKYVGHIPFFILGKFLANRIDSCLGLIFLAGLGAPVAQWVKRWHSDPADRVRSPLEAKSSLR